MSVEKRNNVWCKSDASVTKLWQSVTWCDGVPSLLCLGSWEVCAAVSFVLLIKLSRSVRALRSLHSNYSLFLSSAPLRSPPNGHSASPCPILHNHTSCWTHPMPQLSSLSSLLEYLSLISISIPPASLFNEMPTLQVGCRLNNKPYPKIPPPSRPASYVHLISARINMEYVSEYISSQCEFVSCRVIIDIWIWTGIRRDQRRYAADTSSHPSSSSVHIDLSSEAKLVQISARIICKR